MVYRYLLSCVWNPSLSILLIPRYYLNTIATTSEHFWIHSAVLPFALLYPLFTSPQPSFPLNRTSELHQLLLQHYPYSSSYSSYTTRPHTTRPHTSDTEHPRLLTCDFSFGPLLPFHFSIRLLSQLCYRTLPIQIMSRLPLYSYFPHLCFPTLFVSQLLSLVTWTPSHTQIPWLWFDFLHIFCFIFPLLFPYLTL